MSNATAVSPPAPAPHHKPAHTASHSHDHLPPYVSNPWHATKDALSRFKTYGLSAFIKLVLMQLAAGLLLGGFAVAIVITLLITLGPITGTILSILLAIPAYVALLAAFVFFYTAQVAVVTHAINRSRLSLSDSLDIAKQKFWGVLGLSIIIGLVVGIGFMLLILPGIYLSIRLMYAGYIYIMEKRGVFDSLTDSWNRTENYFWQLAGIGAIPAILYLGLSIVSDVFRVIIEASASQLQTFTALSIGVIIGAVVLAIIGIVINVAMQVIALVGYAYRYYQYNMVATNQMQPPAKVDQLNYILSAVTGGLVVVYVIIFMIAAIVGALNENQDRMRDGFYRDNNTLNDRSYDAGDSRLN